jgi:hypothetical protein
MVVWFQQMQFFVMWTSKLKNPFKVSFIWIECMHFEVLKLSIEPLLVLRLCVSTKMINWSLGWTTKIKIEREPSLQLEVFICVHVKTCFNYWGCHWAKVRSIIHYGSKSSHLFLHFSYWIPKVTSIQFTLGH